MSDIQSELRRLYTIEAAGAAFIEVFRSFIAPNAAHDAEVEKLFFIAEWNGITPEEYIAYVWERAQREAKGETRS